MKKDVEVQLNMVWELPVRYKGRTSAHVTRLGYDGIRTRCRNTRIKVVTRFDKSSLGTAFLFQEVLLMKKEVIGLRVDAGVTMRCLKEMIVK